MSLKALYPREGIFRVISSRSYSKGLFSWGRKKKNEEDDVALIAEEVPQYEPEDQAEYQEMVLQKRNKSRLNPEHRNMVHGIAPYSEDIADHHLKIKYKRRMLGKYGIESVRANIGIAWPTPEEVDDMKEFERVSYPWTLQESWKYFEEKDKMEKERVIARELEIEANLKKMGKWRADLENKIAKKEAEVREAKERKQKLMDEVRRHFGFNIDPKDEKFKEMLEKKEKEQKKLMKEAKKKARQERLLQMLNEEAKKKEAAEKQKTESATETSPPPTSDQAPKESPKSS